MEFIILPSVWCFVGEDSGASSSLPHRRPDSSRRLMHHARGTSYSYIPCPRMQTACKMERATSEMLTDWHSLLRTPSRESLGRQTERGEKKISRPPKIIIIIINKQKPSKHSPKQVTFFVDDSSIRCCRAPRRAEHACFVIFLFISKLLKYFFFHPSFRIPVSFRPENQLSNFFGFSPCFSFFFFLPLPHCSFLVGTELHVRAIVPVRSDASRSRGDSDSVKG